MALQYCFSILWNLMHKQNKNEYVAVESQEHALQNWERFVFSFSVIKVQVDTKTLWYDSEKVERKIQLMGFTKLMTTTIKVKSILIWSWFNIRYKIIIR